MSIDVVTYPISGGQAGVAFTDVVLTPPAQYGFTRYRGAVVSNYSGGIGTVINADDSPVNSPALPPFTSDYFNYTNVRGPMKVHWLNTGVTPPGGSVIIVAFSDDPENDFGGKVYPSALPVSQLASGTPVTPSSPPSVYGSSPYIFNTSLGVGSGTYTVTGAVPAGATVVVAIAMDPSSGSVAIGTVSSPDGNFTEADPSAATYRGLYYLTNATASDAYTVSIPHINPGAGTYIAVLMYVIQNTTAVAIGPAVNNGSGSNPSLPGGVTVPNNSLAVATIMATGWNGAVPTPPSNWVSTTTGGPSLSLIMGGTVVNTGSSANYPFGYTINETSLGWDIASLIFTGTM